MQKDFSLGNVDVVLPPLERFEEYLQSRSKRWTQQRRLLVQHVFSHHEHFDADTLMVELTLLGGPDVPSRPTVYRTLNELVDAGLLRRFQLDGRAVYEHDYGYPQHDHLYCVECRRLLEFHSDDLIRLRDTVAREQGFHVTGHRLTITGICGSCSRSRRRKNRRKRGSPRGSQR